MAIVLNGTTGITTPGLINSGDSTVTGNTTFSSSSYVGIGLTPTSRNNAHLQLLDGIAFPATQVSSSDANVLDDYEEGTWTPIGNAITLVTAVGWYVKIGKVVHIGAQIGWPSNSSSDSASLSGLPFPSFATNSNFLGSVCITNYGSDNLYIFVSAGTSNIFVRNNNNSDLTNANMSNKFAQFMASYIVP